MLLNILIVLINLDYKAGKIIMILKSEACKRHRIMSDYTIKMAVQNFQCEAN